MQVLKVFLLVILAVALVFCGWFYLAGMSAERTVFSNEYYHGLVSEVGLPAALHAELQEALPQLMLAGMTEDMDEEMPEEMPEGVEELMRLRLEIMAGALTRAFDAAWLEQQFLLVIDDVLALVKGEQETLEAMIDLQDGKERFREELIAELEALPPEKAEELEMPSEMAGPIADQVLEEMDLPDRIELAELLGEEGISPEVESVLSRVQQFRNLFRFVPYIVFALILLISLLLAGIAGGLKWFGAASLFFSVTFLVGLQLLRVVSMAPLLAGIEAEMPFGPGLLQPGIEFTVSRVSMVPLICTAAALVLLITGIVLGRVLRKA